MDVNTADQELLAAFRQADRKQKEYIFTLLIRKYQERLYWQIRRMVVTHEDTDDVLQTVFIKVWKGLDQFREHAQLYTWLYRIATNECLTFLEQQKKRKTVPVTDWEEKIKAEPQFDARKIEWQLQLAIQKLPEKQRRVFMMRYYDELPYETMSQLLDTSVGALKSSYHHAAKKIAEQLKNH